MTYEQQDVYVVRRQHHDVDEIVNVCETADIAITILNQWDHLSFSFVTMMDAVGTSWEPPPGWARGNTDEFVWIEQHSVVNDVDDPNQRTQETK